MMNKIQEMRKVYSHYGNYTAFNKVVRHAFAESLENETDYHYTELCRIWENGNSVLLRDCYPHQYEFVKSIKESLDFKSFWKEAKEASEKNDKCLVGHSIARWEYKGWKGYINLSYQRNAAGRWHPVFTYNVNIDSWKVDWTNPETKEGFDSPYKLLAFIDDLDFVIVEKLYGKR